MPNDTDGKFIILFDGECNFCSWWVSFLLKRDGYDRFRFCALQSPAAKEFLERFEVHNPIGSTFYFIEDERLYYSSTGVLRVFKNLPGLWPALFALRLIPAFLRDPVYELFARNRYKWYGRRECLVPDEKLRPKFII